MSKITSDDKITSRQGTADLEGMDTGRNGFRGDEFIGNPDGNKNFDSGFYVSGPNEGKDIDPGFIVGGPKKDIDPVEIASRNAPRLVEDLGKPENAPGDDGLRLDARLIAPDMISLDVSKGSGNWIGGSPSWSKDGPATSEDPGTGKGGPAPSDRPDMDTKPGTSKGGAPAGGRASRGDKLSIDELLEQYPGLTPEVKGMIRNTLEQMEKDGFQLERDPSTGRTKMVRTTLMKVQHDADGNPSLVAVGTVSDGKFAPAPGADPKLVEEGRARFEENPDMKSVDGKRYTLQEILEKEKRVPAGVGRNGPAAGGDDTPGASKGAGTEGGVPGEAKVGAGSGASLSDVAIKADASTPSARTMEGRPEDSFEVKPLGKTPANPGMDPKDAVELLGDKAQPGLGAVKLESSTVVGAAGGQIGNVQQLVASTTTDIANAVEDRASKIVSTLENGKYASADVGSTIVAPTGVGGAGKAKSSQMEM